MQDVENQLKLLWNLATQARLLEGPDGDQVLSLTAQQIAPRAGRLAGKLGGTSSRRSTKLHPRTMPSCLMTSSKYLRKMLHVAAEHGVSLPMPYYRKVCQLCFNFLEPTTISIEPMSGRQRKAKGPFNIEEKVPVKRHPETFKVDGEPERQAQDINAMDDDDMASRSLVLVDKIMAEYHPESLSAKLCTSEGRKQHLHSLSASFQCPVPGNHDRKLGNHGLIRKVRYQCKYCENFMQFLGVEKKPLQIQSAASLSLPKAASLPAGAKRKAEAVDVGKAEAVAVGKVASATSCKKSTLSLLKRKVVATEESAMSKFLASISKSK